MGVEEPQSLAEWADVGLGCNRLPWLQGQDLLRLKRMLESFQLIRSTVSADRATAGSKRYRGVLKMLSITSVQRGVLWSMFC